MYERVSASSSQNLSGEGHSWLVRAYLVACSGANRVVQSELFNNTIFFCIVVAGVLVGASTYPGMDDSAVVAALDQVVLGFFCLEVLLKVMSEGVAPYQYFVGPEWTWNNFDFLIVLFSLPILPVGGSQVAFLRLIRLMRLAKVFRKVPQLRMIMTGLIGGLKSIVYIVILLLLVFYLYAIAGIFFFRDNDPWHFRTIAVSLTSLFRLSTLSVSGRTSSASSRLQCSHKLVLNDLLFLRCTCM
jgi:voltage-gated sodium channel